MKANKINSFFISIFLSVLLFGQSLYAKEPFKQPFTEYTFECGQEGGQIVLSATSDPKSFNPIVAQETSTTQITSLIFEGLTRTHPLTLEVEPNLAHSWKTKDGKEWIFYLRDDVFFNDGVQFSADDVVFTFDDIIYNDSIPTGSRDIFTIEDKKIKVQKIDDFTVKFKLPNTFAPFLRALSQSILPKHKYQESVNNDTFTFSMGLDSNPEDIVGTGPFKLKKYLAGERIILDKNPHYWKKDSCGQKLPYLQKIVFIILPNLDTALLKFLEEQIDYYPLRTQDLSILGPVQELGNFTIYNAGPSFGSEFLVFNLNPSKNTQTKKPIVKPKKLKLFSNKSFRQAIAYAIDRNKIIEIVMNGLGIPQYSPESPANKFFYSDDVKKYPYNPDKAKEILLKLGFKDRDDDGILEDKQREDLEITFFTNANNTQRVQIATLIKKDLQDIGIEVHFLPLDFNNLVSKLTATYDWEMILIGLTGSIEPYFGKNVWSYKGNLHAWNPTKKAIFAFEHQIEDIFNKAAVTLDEDKRRKLFAKWQSIASDELPLIYTVVSYSLYAVRDKFGNLYPTVYGGAFSEIEYIYLEDDGVKK
jgi:peptide/nickel transport system substrate-binding protein